MNALGKTAASGGGSTGLTVLLEWYAYRNGIELTNVAAIAITGVLTPVVMFLGEIGTILGHIVLAKIRAYAPDA